jgi:hypothetical protein
VKPVLESIKTCPTDPQNVSKICNIQQGVSVSVDLEAQKYAIYNKYLVHFDPKNMQICHLHMVELPGASGSCSGRLASKYSRRARTGLNSSGDVLSAAGIYPRMFCCSPAMFALF